MSRAHTVRLTTREVERLAGELLTQRMAGFGIDGLDVAEERDFDGDDVLRVVVRVREKVPAKTLIGAADELQQTLRREGEDRWVYLSTKRPEEREVGEDVD